MNGSQYIFTATRFYCGCSYRTIGDTAVFCPEHRAEPHRGFITGEETIRIPSPQPPDILRLGMNKHLTNQPRTLRNTEYNSIYTKVQVMGPGQEEWESERAEEVGLCAACFIESLETWETGIAMCECGNENCPYRWCGSTAGIHALWRLHAQGLCLETIQTDEQDIFTRGPYAEMDDETREKLDQERNGLERKASELLMALQRAREQARPESPQRNYQPIFLPPWLDQDYRLSLSQDPRERSIGTKGLRTKLLRLHIIGAVPGNA